MLRSRLGAGFFISDAADPSNASSSSEIPPVQTTVTVTEKVAAETPAAMIVLGQKQLKQTPGREPRRSLAASSRI